MKRTRIGDPRQARSGDPRQARIGDPRQARRTLIINGALVTLCAGTATAAVLSLSGDDPAAGGRTAEVARGTVLASVSAAGSIESADQRSLDFATSGTVEKIKVEAGDTVKKGDLLARLDDEAAKDELAAAEADLDAKDGDTSSAAYLTAKKTYNAAKRALTATRLKAPFSGTVVAVNGEQGGSSTGSSTSSGDSASTGDATAGTSGSTSGETTTSADSGFIVLADTGDLQIAADFTEADVSRLEKGQDAAVSFEAFPGLDTAGEITGIDPLPTTEDNVVKFGVTVALDDPDKKLRLGQTAKIKVVVDKADDVLYLPTSALGTQGRQASITVVRNGRRTATTVELGVKGDQTTEIISGVQEGDHVVLPDASGQSTSPAGILPGQRGGRR